MLEGVDCIKDLGWFPKVRVTLGGRHHKDCSILELTSYYGPPF